MAACCSTKHSGVNMPEAHRRSRKQTAVYHVCNDTEKKVQFQ